MCKCVSPSSKRRGKCVNVCYRSRTSSRIRVFSAYRPQGPSVQLSAAQKISRRLRSRPLPRFRPFQCSRCGLATHHLHLVRDHQCRKRRRRAPNPEEVQRCLELGGKSGLRNWMRVLEGAEQSVQFAMPRLHFVSHLDLHCNQPNSR